jgi:rod shape-determining protein MreB
VRRVHQLVIGEASAERIKIEAGSASKDAPGRPAEIHISGRELKTGRPKKVVLAPENIAEALEDVVAAMGDFVERALEDLPPEVSAAVGARGIHLTGGGALLHMLDRELERRVRVKFHRPEDPMHCVVKGSAAVLERLSEHKHLLIDP